MLPCDILLAAIDVENSSKVSSVAGIAVSWVSAQKVVNFLQPVFFVECERPRIM